MTTEHREHPATREVIRLADEAKAAKVVGHFSGGNDEGGYDSILLYTEGGVEIGGVNTEWDSPLSRAMDGYLSQWGSFAGEFSVDGTVEVDVKAGRAKIAYDEQSGYDHHEHTW
jgi:hypothetical protein